VKERVLVRAAVVAGLIGVCSLHEAPAAEPAAPATAPCAECGMNVEVGGRFASRIVQGATTLFFCDIGDLVSFVNRTQPKEPAASVRDYPSGEWIAASEAVFAIDTKAYPTPMGWGIAAFRDRKAVPGTPLDFPALQRALR